MLNLAKLGKTRQNTAKRGKTWLFKLNLVKLGKNWLNMAI
jgi:hypothetical protein